MKKLLIFSMKRSGQHAIINWLCEQNKPSLHFNACDSDMIPKKFNIMEYGHQRIQHNMKKFDFQKFNLIVYNFEDIDILPLKGKKIIILREPRNWIASRLKSNEKIDSQKINIWKNHARSNLFKIMFDKWFVDKEYRKHVCDELDLTFTDKGINEVFWHGKSSFDERNFNGQAQNMNVLERWKEYDNIDIDAEMKRLWLKLSVQK